MFAVFAKSEAYAGTTPVLAVTCDCVGCTGFGAGDDVGLAVALGCITSVSRADDAVEVDDAEGELCLAC